MSLNFYIFIASFVTLVALVLRKHYELKNETSSRFAVLMNRVDTLFVEYFKVAIHFADVMRKRLNVGALLHVATVCLVSLSKAYEKTKRYFMFRTEPFFHKIRGKREIERGTSSLYVRDMLEYKSNLGR